MRVGVELPQRAVAAPVVARLACEQRLELRRLLLGSVDLAAGGKYANRSFTSSRSRVASRPSGM
jgi:hypothetical protein